MYLARKASQQVHDDLGPGLAEHRPEALAVEDIGHHRRGAQALQERAL
jgi:hypothetical protein